MGFKFENLVIVGEWKGVNVMSVSEFFQGLNGCSYFFWFEVGDGHLSHVITRSPVFVDVNIVNGAKNAFGEMFRNMMFVAGAANAFDELWVLFGMGE